MDRNELICQNIQTVLLGYTAHARRLARDIYRRYGIRSYICDRRGALCSAFAASFAFWKMPPSEHRDISCEELLHLASFDPSCIYIALPCSEEYAELLRDIRDRIESTYIISTPNDVFGKIPVFDIWRKK